MSQSPQPPKNIFRGNPGYSHRQLPVTGILLSNLGTPDAPTTAALRRYLREFLSDPRVIELPRLLWWTILNLFILPFRPRKSAALYRSVWSEQGSPLLVTSKSQLEGFRKKLEEEIGSPVVVALGMRYGNPSIAKALEELRQHDIGRLLVIPLYPQYSSATTGSTFDAVAEVLKGWRRVPDLRFVAQYHDHPGYIEAVCEKVRATWNKTGKKPEKLLLSFHGIPKRYFLGGDPYHCHCQKTGRLIAENLALTSSEYLVSFQSLFGKEEWIKPYTDKTLESWAQAGLKSVDVACPGFLADCLETLEEIDEQNRELFLHSGGERFNYIPAVNDSPKMIEALVDIARQNLVGWVTPKESWNQERAIAEAESSQRRFELLSTTLPQSLRPRYD